MSLSYLHNYHAGNLADVHKHLWLQSILTYLFKKEKPLFLLDTHSGHGRYDLSSAESLKTGEAEWGILEVLDKLGDWDATTWQTYRSIIQRSNQNTSACRYYPGSPLIMAQQMRPADRLICCEKHPRVQAILRENLAGYSNVRIEHADMFKVLPALIPPEERRGLVFIDPSYEIKSEYADIPNALLKAYRKWQTGVYLLWYPLLPQGLHKQLQQCFSDFPAEILFDEWHFSHTHSAERGLYGSAVLVINPPYTVPESMATIKAKMIQTKLLLT